jgi:NADH:ubiquinone oxidoreductase subunit K
MNPMFNPISMNSLFANLLTEPVGVSHYVVVGAFMFTCGILCMATKRNALGILMGIEMVLNGANLNFIAFGSRYLRNDDNSLGLDGQLISLFVIVLAAAEAAVALAIVLNFYNNTNSIDVDRADQLQG